MAVVGDSLNNYYLETGQIEEQKIVFSSLSFRYSVDCGLWKTGLSKNWTASSSF